MKIKMMHRNQELWLESDENNFIIHRGFKKSTDKKGNVTEVRISPSYYSSLELCINGLVKKAMHRSDATTLEDMYAEIRDLKQLILDKVYV